MHASVFDMDFTTRISWILSRRWEHKTTVNSHISHARRSFFFIACHWIILQYARLKGCAITVSAEHCRTRTISAFEFPPSKRRPPNGLDQHAAWSTPSPLVEARLVYHGLSDVPPQGSPSERLDAIEGCLWKETKRVVIVLQGVPSEPWSPQNLRALVKYLAALFCLPSRRRLSSSKWLPSRCPTDAHEWVLGSPSCSWLWERCDILIYTDVPARGQRARGFRRLLRCEARYHMAQCSWAPA